MALIKYGGGIIDMRGSIAGNTHARNRFGNYMRARTKPVNPKSERQEAARTVIRFLAEQWREDPMNDAKRLAWEVYAAGVNWNNALGETVKLTGFNMFIRANAALLRIDKAIVTDGPPDIGLPPGDPDAAISLVSAGTQDVTFTYNDTMGWNNEDSGALVIEMGMPQNPTRNFFGGPWRVAGWRFGVAPAGPASPQVNMAWAAWPFILGQKIWWRASIIMSDGRMSTKFSLDTTIVVA